MRFNELVGEEIAKALVTVNATQGTVAIAVGVERATLNRYLNGKKPIPLATFNDVCEAIGAEPRVLIDRAYVRLVAELGAPR